MPQKDPIKAKTSVAPQQIGSLLLCKVFHSLAIKLSFLGFHMINWTQCLTTRKWRGSNGSLPIGPFASIFRGFDDQQPLTAEHRAVISEERLIAAVNRAAEDAGTPKLRPMQPFIGSGACLRASETKRERFVQRRQRRANNSVRFLPDYQGLFYPFLPVRQRYAIIAAK